MEGTASDIRWIHNEGAFLIAVQIRCSALFEETNYTSFCVFVYCKVVLLIKCFRTERKKYDFATFLFSIEIWLPSPYFDIRWEFDFVNSFISHSVKIGKNFVLLSVIPIPMLEKPDSGRLDI